MSTKQSKLWAVVCLALVGSACACTPADRARAAAIEGTVAPVVCALVPLIAPEGSPAGLVCADVAKAVGALLAASSHLRARPAPPTTACTPLYLHELDAKRDVREFVCSEQINRAQVTQALQRQASGGK